jgi:hypothetical protein
MRGKRGGEYPELRGQGTPPLGKENTARLKLGQCALL